MISVLIVDDEAPARDELRYLLEETGKVSILGEGANGFEAVALCRKIKVDVIFLDIQMPGKNGIDAAREIVDLPDRPIIVFQTAYDDFALQAFEVHAMDYILKPLSPKRLMDTLAILEDRMSLKMSHKESQDRLLDLLHNLDKEKGKTEKHYPLSLYRGESIIPVKQEDILFVEARGREVRLVTVRGDFCQNKPFWQIEEQLTLPDFFRCHRGYIINLTYVEQVDIWVNNSYMIKLYQCDEKVPVSRGHMAEFKEILHI
jgi:DNA-binding LytR/AlgR family response regulator